MSTPAFPPAVAATGRSREAAWIAYVRLARPDHWAKNVLMVPGIVVALFYVPERLAVESWWPIALALAATCLVASSNYVLNELLDAATDRFHPEKSARPAVIGTVRRSWALIEWVALGALGVALALSVNLPVGATAAGLWLMGVLYNAPLVRTKEWPYLDVLSESANNVLRLGLGWFAVMPEHLPPFSLLLAYWMGGAFLMAVKRLAEYRELALHGAPSRYRRSFGFYTEQSLLVSSIFYATLGAHFGGMFILRYRLELVLMAPLIAGLFAGYMRIAFKPQSAAQHPERLYREGALAAYLVLCFGVFVLLMVVEIPSLYEWFTVRPAGTEPLWRFGPP